MQILLIAKKRWNISAILNIDNSLIKNFSVRFLMTFYFICKHYAMKLYLHTSLAKIVGGPQFVRCFEQ